MGIIGGDPKKHWSRNKTTRKILIKNPDLTIKIVDITFNLIETK